MKIQKISVVVAMLIVINSPVFSQNKAVKFGKVPDEEVGMNVFQADTSAEAVVLHSLGTSEIDYVQNLGFVLRYTEYKKIKILKKEGLDLGNIEISSQTKLIVYKLPKLFTIFSIYSNKFSQQL